MNEADPLYPSVIVICVFNALSAFTAIMLNILTIYAMRKTSSLLAKPLKTYLLSLAVSDLGVGLLVQPLYIAWMLSPSSSLRAPFNISALAYIYAPFFLVVAISVDRFLAIHLHLRYRELVTHKRVVAVVISIWTMSVPSSPLIFLSLSSKKPFRLLMAVICGFCFVITGIIYSRMYFNARHHANQIQVLQMHVAQNSQIENAARKRKATISMFYVYIVFLVCYLPQYCVAVAGLIQSSPSTALHSLHLYSRTLTFLNSSLNPVIYGWKMRHIRHAMIDVLRNLFPKQNQANL